MTGGEITTSPPINSLQCMWFRNAAVVTNRATRWDAEAIVRHGRRFDEETFRNAITTAVAELGPGDASSAST